MNNFFDLLNNGTTQFHVVAELEKRFKANGFSELKLTEEFSLNAGGKYYIKPYSSMLVAFIKGESGKQRLSVCHTDFPMLKVKPNPIIKKSGYVEINVEPYGGLITSTWFDRPLGLAGKVIVKSDNIFEPTAILYDSKKPLFSIPNLAPHLSRDKKGDLDVQKEVIPITCTLDASNNLGDSQNPLNDYIANDLDISAEDILDYDLYLYVYGQPTILGLNDEFISSARIDNISSAGAICEALCQTNNITDTAVGVFFDNEEIGSRSKQGADSMLLRDILCKIDKEVTIPGNAFSISVDVAHATHPNYAEKSDITNNVLLGGGVVLKSSASQRYVTDSEAGAVIASLSKLYDIKIQRQANRSGMAGGQTLGPILSSYIPVKAVDMGIPMLAMHSANELIHRDDYLWLVKLLISYYQHS